MLTLSEGFIVFYERSFEMGGGIRRRFALVRLWKRSTLAIGIVLGSVLLTGQPAMAAPFWQTFTRTPTWECDRISSDSSIANVQICVVVNGRAAQVVATVRNDTSRFIEIIAETDFEDFDQITFDDCLESSLGAGLARACFGTTLSGACGELVEGTVRVGVRRQGAVEWSPANGQKRRTYCS